MSFDESQCTITNLQFMHSQGLANVRADLDRVLKTAKKSLQAAVCFFTEPGRVILSRHIEELNHPSSFFIASVVSPTNLDALNRLHQMAPGHVYIHLGGKTPEEKKVGRSLMHSKLYLAEDFDKCCVWVGSHNLTAMAIEGGNFEAGVIFDSHPSSKAIQDIKSHLEICRIKAEVFNPNDMERYREIQKGYLTDSEWDVEKDVLIIHATAEVKPKDSPFILHAHLLPVQLDSLFRMDRSVRLFVHPMKSLRRGIPVDYGKAELWNGEITAVVRTERHPNHQGTSGSFAGADYDIDIHDLNTIPQLVRSGGSSLNARTQAVMRFDFRGDLGQEVYSTSKKSPIQNVMDVSNPLDMHDVDKDLAKYFTPESIKNGKLVYSPAVGVHQKLAIEGFEETMRSVLPKITERESLFKIEDSYDLSSENMVRYDARYSKNEIDPFLYLSRHVIRRKD